MVGLVHELRPSMACIMQCTRRTSPSGPYGGALEKNYITYSRQPPAPNNTYRHVAWLVEQTSLSSNQSGNTSPNRRCRMTQATTSASSLPAKKSEKKPSFHHLATRGPNDISSRHSSPWHARRSLVASRVTCSLPYQRLTKGEQDQVDAMLRKAYKASLKLPPGTPTSRLLTLGLDTYAELFEAQLTTQLQRLTQTPRGRVLILRLGYIGQLHEAARRKPIPDHLRTTYKPPSPAIRIPDCIRAGGKPDWKPSNETTGTGTFYTM
ncbi:hypothetical protein HPB52_014204 [Rhipicephalus sanguineus]|uniref:Uncharacterized protein n=1 Tax=Rhipicephalus sanguineus TaxID=34632 RepID=A0A9D4SXF2_RHISA|nr:hypothetical protein HPB52_014204 [Rhipicephalus sanguineus]